MSNLVPFNRDRAFLMPPDLKAWLPGDDLAHVVVGRQDGCRLARSRFPGGLAASRSVTRG